MKLVSISGGGMRGIGSVEILRNIELRLGKPLHEVFDMVVGTSTGGIIAALIACGCSMNEALRFYKDSGPRIFSKSLYKDAKQLLTEKYRETDIVRELKLCMGDRRMKDARTKLMLTSVRNDSKAEMFKSWREEWSEVPIWNVAQATSAAQSYFPQAKIVSKNTTAYYIDGGNVRNAPMVPAAFEAFREFGTTEPITLIHIGTGIEANPKLLPTGGLLAWVLRMLGVMMNADESYDTYIAEDIDKLVPNFRFLKLDFVLDRFPSLDDASPKTLNMIQQSAYESVQCEAFEDIISALTVAHGRQN